MRNTKIWMLLTVVALTFLFVGAVSAADNTAVDTVKIKEKQNTQELVNVKQTQAADMDNAVSTVKKDQSNLKYVNAYTKKQYKHKVLINAPSKTFKYKSNSHFKISIKDSTTHDPLINQKVKFTLSIGKLSKSKYYNTNSKGEISLNTKNLKIGVYKARISISDSKNYYGAIKNANIVISKNPIYAITVPFDDLADSPIHTHKLQTGQKLVAFYTAKDGQYDKGIYIGTLLSPTQGEHSNTRLLKAYVFFDSPSTGRVITKIYTQTDSSHANMKPIKMIKGYIPTKVKVWYKLK